MIYNAMQILYFTKIYNNSYRNTTFIYKKLICNSWLKILYNNLTKKLEGVVYTPVKLLIDSYVI